MAEEEQEVAAKLQMVGRSLGLLALSLVSGLCSQMGLVPWREAARADFVCLRLLWAGMHG
eukprot:1161864-Pelagomonas_calceolata.AAC.15